MSLDIAGHYPNLVAQDYQPPTNPPCHEWGGLNVGLRESNLILRVEVEGMVAG